MGVGSADVLGADQGWRPSDGAALAAGGESEAREVGMTSWHPGRQYAGVAGARLAHVSLSAPATRVTSASEGGKLERHERMVTGSPVTDRGHESWE